MPEINVELGRDPSLVIGEDADGEKQPLLSARTDWSSEHGSSPAAGVRKELEFGRTGLYEAKDARGRWWPVTVVSQDAAGALSVIVHDGRGTSWPSLPPTHLRLIVEGDAQDTGAQAASPVSLRLALRTVAFCIVLDSLADAVAAPALPFLADSYGAQTAISDIVLLYAVWSVSNLLLSPALNVVAESYGPRAVLLCSLLVQSAASVLQAVSTDFAMLCLARAVAGGFAATGAMSAFYLAETADTPFATEWQPISATTLGLTRILGPPLGGCLCQLGVGVPAGVSAAIGAVSFFSVLLHVPPRTIEQVDRAHTCEYGGGVGVGCRVVDAGLAEGRVVVTFATIGEAVSDMQAQQMWQHSCLDVVTVAEKEDPDSKVGHGLKVRQVSVVEDASDVEPLAADRSGVRGMLVFDVDGDFGEVVEFKFRFGPASAGYSSCVLPFGVRGCSSQSVPMPAWRLLCKHTSRRTWGVLLSAVFAGVCFSVSLSVCPAFAMRKQRLMEWQVSPVAFGLLFSGVAAAGVLPSLFYVRSAGAAVPVSSWVERALGTKWATAAGVATCGCALLVVPVMPNLAAMGGLLCVARAGRMVAERSTATLLKEHLLQHPRATLYLRLRQFCLDIGFALGCVVSGCLIDVWVMLPFVVAAVSAVLCGYFTPSVAAQDSAAGDWMRLRPRHETDAQWADFGCKAALLLRRKRYPVTVAEAHLLQALADRFPTLDTESRSCYLQGLRDLGLVSSGTSTYQRACDRFCVLERQRL